MAVFPVRSHYHSRAVTPDDTGDETASFGRVDKAAIGQRECFAGLGTGESGGSARFLIALFGRAARTHFAGRQIDKGKTELLLLHEQRAASGTPFDVVRMRAEEQNVQSHISL
jgi:hypothetical protein